MQLDPLEVWDLLALLGLPKAWDEGRLEFFERASPAEPGARRLRGHGSAVPRSREGVRRSSRCRGEAVRGRTEQSSNVEGAQCQQQAEAQAFDLDAITEAEVEVVGRPGAP